ncbi:hypothetical protein ACROYT_G031931 [Oculina patagonica]
MKLSTVICVVLVDFLIFQFGSSLCEAPCGTTGTVRSDRTESIRTKSSFESVVPQKVDNLSWTSLATLAITGALRGLQECQKLFNNEMWTCPSKVYKKLPIFDNTTLADATRETAFIHAISAAAITHEITHQCRQGKVPGCRCIEVDLEKQREEFGIWARPDGCSDNIEFGEREVRRFLDKIEKGNDARAAVNRHNDQVGIQVT